MDQKMDPVRMISLDLKTLYLEFRDKSLLLAIPVLILCSFYLMSLLMALNAIWPLYAGLILLVLSGLIIWFHQHNWIKPAAWLLSCGMFLLCYLIFRWSGQESVLILFVLPVGLSAILIGTAGGFVFAFFASLYLFLLPAAALSPDAYLKGILIFIYWAAAGLVFLSQNPLRETIEVAWADYLQSRKLLEQNREYQIQLRQVLEDLTHISTQLVRMNDLANTLRVVAQEERDAKEQFVANVSHELRTPLNMIVGFSEMILQSPEIYARTIPEKLLADLMIILRNAQHLSGLIDDVLDLSQIDAGQMALLRERTSLVEIIDAAVTAIRPLFQSKGLYLKKEVAADIPLVYCDRTRIRQVVLNLLSNAGRFTEKGGVSIHAWLEKSNVIVSVADTGIGISEENKANLFQPFQQMDASIRRQYGGTGLGLSISKNFVELHNGKLWVESSPEQGSVFSFQLQVDPQVEAGVSALRWLTPYFTPERLRRISPLTIPEIRQRWVIVENGKMLQKLLHRYIENVDILPVSNLAQAQRLIAQEPVNALLVNDPDASDCLPELTRNTSLPVHLPILVCAIPETAYIGETHDVVDYLIKPVTQERLFKILETLPEGVKTILVVDDEPDVHRLFGRILDASKRNYRMLRAFNGIEALEILKHDSVDLILLDLVMPETDGFQFLGMKQQEPQIKDIPVILISARDPQGHPIYSRNLTVTRTGGLSVRQLLACVEAFSAILAPKGSSGGPRQPEMRFDPPV